MNNKKNVRINSYEHHSNMALLTTVIALASFVVLMIVYMGDHSPQRVEMAIGASKFCAVLYWLISAVLSYSVVKKGKKYLTEYIVYMIITGFGLFFMYNMPMFMYELLKDTIIATNWARGIFRVLAIGSVIYSGVSIGYHMFRATPRRTK